MYASGAPPVAPKRGRETGEGGLQLLAGATEKAVPPRRTSGNSNHVLTEQKRRDRINKGFDELRALIQVDTKLDKAAFLAVVVDYIKKVQGVLGEVISGAGSEALSDERKWQIRMLLPRPDALKTLALPVMQPAAPGPAADSAAPAAAASAASAPAPACALFTGLPAEQQAQAHAFLQALQLQQARPAVIQLSQVLQQAAGTPGALAATPAQQATAPPPAVEVPTATCAAAACGGDVAGDAEADADAPAPKARKGALGAKVRRHTTAAKVAPPEAAATAGDLGRPEAAVLPSAEAVV